MKSHKFVLLAAGILSGILCGLLGVGGGIIIVLYLTLFLHEEQHIAQATAISVILASALVSSGIYWHYKVLDWQIIARCMLGSIGGGYIGAKLMKKIPAKMLRRLFAVFILLAGFRMLI